MAWDFERSNKRVDDERKRIEQSGISVKPLAREMDLANLSPTEARLVHGVHLYSTIENLEELLKNDLLRRNNFRGLHRFLHVLRIEQRRIIQKIFDGDKIQVQGSKFHGLIFKPYGRDSEMAWRSVLCSVALHQSAVKALPKVFPNYPAVVSTAGLEIGNAVVANIGMRGERELISVGRPANYAAKISDGLTAITIGENLYSQLTKEQQLLFTAAQGVFRLDPSVLNSLEDAIWDEGFIWNTASSVRNIERETEAIPLDDILIEEAREKIDLERLGPKHAKVCVGATVFVDIDGYTRFIDSLADDVERLAKAVQLLHLFRYEWREITQCDFAAIEVQHQGDRLQALLHVPTGDEERIKERAVNLAISYNSSVEEVLSKYCENDRPFHVAIGCDVGKVLVSRLGVRGDLDATCIGRSTLRAEDIQIGSKGGEIGLTRKIHNAIQDESISKLFEYIDVADAYVAKGLTWTALEDAEHASAYRSASAAVITGGGAIAFRNPMEATERPLKVTRPWSE
jgi:class 3 adenylate cyclase